MPLRFTLRPLEYLTAVGAAGTIAQAAQRLNVPSPSISIAIVQIEADFGFPIFVRKHAQSMSPTDGGRQLMARAVGLIDAAHRLNDLVNDITGRIRGPFRVGWLLTFAQIVLPRLRRAYVDRFPESAFIQSEADQSALIEGLRTAKIDIALTYDLSVPTDLEFVELLSLSPDGRRLRILPLTGPVRPMRMGLLHSGGGGALPKVQTFGQLCKEMLSAQSLTGMGLGAFGLVRA